MVLATALGLLAVPAGASAKPGFKVQERNLQSTLMIKGSNGFRGFISTEGHKQVTLTLLKGGTKVELRTSGRVSRHGISARFGDLGRVAVRFQGKPVPADPRPRRDRRREKSKRRCSGREPIVESGMFHGTIHFRGENDFARIDAERALGFVEQRFRRVCERPPKKSLAVAFEELFGSLQIGLLEARARVDGTIVVLEAASIDLSWLFGPGTPPAYAFTGHTVERGDGLRVVRAAEAEGEGGDGTLRASKPGRTPRIVTVAPPKPFLESAKHLKEPGIPASWVGSLAVRLPGAGLVPLTGPGFKSAACNLTLDELIEGDRCLPRRVKPDSGLLAALARASAQGSGSQSQAFWDARLSWSR